MLALVISRWHHHWEMSNHARVYLGGGVKVMRVIRQKINNEI